VDRDELFDDDGNFLRAVLVKSTADRHNDLNDDLNTDLDGDSHIAAVNHDPLDESDGDLDFLNDLSNNWTTVTMAIELFNINADTLLETNDNVMQVLITMARFVREATATLQALDQVGGSILQQRADGNPIVADRLGVSEETKGDEEEEEAKDAFGEHCDFIPFRRPRPVPRQNLNNSNGVLAGCSQN